MSVSLSPPSPAIVASGGTTNLSASATDVWGHGLTWSWTDGGAGGSFSDASAQNPSYTAPGNATDLSRTITLTVTATCDGPSPLTQSDTTTLQVQPAAHAVIVTASTTPGTIASGGTTVLAASAVDAQSHSIAAWSWSDGGAGGSFSPSADIQSPSYTAPANTTDTDQVIVLSAIATCGGAIPIAGAGVADLTVHPVTHTFSVTADPPAPATVASGGSAALSATVTDSRTGHGVSWLWSDNGAGGSFSPSATVRNPQYTAPDNPCHSEVPVTLTVTATCDSADPVTATDDVVLAVSPFQVFSDVPLGHWAFASITACVNAAVVAGYPDGLYRPVKEVSRDQMAVFIARALAGGDSLVPAGPDTPTFPDVPTTQWASKYVEYCAANNVVVGYGDGTYQPAWTVTRSQMAVYIARSIVTPTGEAGLAGYTPPTTPTFSDVATSYWAYKHIEYLAEQDVVRGYLDGLYRPATVVTRDQMAAYIERAFGLRVPCS